MKKQSPWLILILSTVIFLTVSLAVPFHRTEVFWFAFAFGIIAFAAQILFFKCAFDDAKIVKSKLYGFPIIRIGLLYVAIQLLVSFAFMALTTVAPLWLVILISVVLMCLAGLGLIVADEARREVERPESLLPERTRLMKQIRAESEAFAIKAPEGLRDAAKKLAEAVRYSDPITTSIMEEVDNALFFELQTLVSAPSINGINEFAQKLEQRNLQCKANK